MTVQVGLCQTYLETPNTGFLVFRLIPLKASMGGSKIAVDIKLDTTKFDTKKQLSLKVMLNGLIGKIH